MIFWAIARGQRSKGCESVADKLKIQFDVVNFVNFYHQEVVQPMVQGYADGITPNPDIL